MNSKKLSWQYVAGFFDGEGTCCFSKCGNQNSRLSANITQKNSIILKEIKNFLGYGCLYQFKGRFSKDKCYRLGFSAAQARHFLVNMSYYSQHPDKQKQIKKALALDKKHVRPR